MKKLNKAYNKMTPARFFFLKSGDFGSKNAKNYLLPILPPLLQTNHAFSHSAIKTDSL